MSALDRSGEVAGSFLGRHVSGDWGDLSEDDRLANVDALANDARILSAYVTAAGERFWIITEADREYTTLLLPEEY